jgi:DNA-binding transcriptional regulator LsrR (DeoR family)
MNRRGRETWLAGSAADAADPGITLALQAARLFFDRQLSKVEIARRLGISRFRVARLIDQALARGLVRIEFRDLPVQDRALAGALEERWGLDLCAVARPLPGAEPLLAVARLAASVVGELIGPTDVVGIGWGSTLAAVVSEMAPRQLPGVTVVQLAGGSIRVEAQRTPHELARRLAQRLGGEYRPLLAPAFVESRAVRDALLREPEVAATVADFRRVTLAIVGIGALGEGSDARSALVDSGALAPSALAAAVAAGAVGDLLLFPFDADGRFVVPELAERAVAISLEDLRAVPRVVAVAAGREKARAIRGALATGIVDILVTDVEAATALVEEEAKEGMVDAREAG